MTDDERYIELYKIREATIEKYVNYLIALTVAAIAYSINITKDTKLSKETIPVLLALFCWGLSFTCGCCYVVSTIKVRGLNMSYFQKQESDKEFYMRHIKDKIQKAGIFYIIQSWFLGLGMLFFVMWYVYHLYGNSLV